MTNPFRPPASDFVFPSPLIYVPRSERNRRRRPRWPGIILAFILGLAFGWLLRDGGAIIP